MGKNKGRTASSGLAASLLPHAQAAVPTVGFGGYHGASRVEQPAAAALPSSSADTDASIRLPPDVDSEVLQHLRRLGRKDPTTKLKALSTLSMLFAQKPGEEVVQIVPQWAFEYKRLLLDYNREVRRGTHETMSSLVKTVKKGLAPHLKSLMGPWWFSQFDPSLEVAQAARHSFEAAFPQSDKRLDALMLCVKETFLHLNENLKLTTQALSDKATPMDELEDMHQRVISSSLLAMATLIDILLGVKLQNCDRDSSSSENKSLSKVLSATLSSAESAFSIHKYFLDFLKSKCAIIRSASYTLLTSYIKHVSHVFNEETMRVLSPALLGAFHEKDPSCHSSMWDAFLAFSGRFPEAWSYCNIQKFVFNRFWHFLRNGCYGSKQISYPLLVQFLESIPSEAVTAEQFVFDFLHNLWAGRNQRQLSAADSLAYFTAFKHSFLWLLKVLSRHSECGSSDAIPIKLITSILAKFIWHDYLLVSSSKNYDISLSGLSDEANSGVCQLSHKESLLPSNTRYPTYYLHDLGKCIIEILDEISAMENHLLKFACETLSKDCLDIILQRERLSNFEDHVQQVVSFFISLDQLIVQKGKTWPLESLARPLIEQSVPAIKSMDTPILVKLLSVLVEIFRPVPLFLKNSQRESEESLQAYLDVFNDEFVPWCLDGKYSTCSSKIDLLLSLIIDEGFFDQWCLIIKYTIAKQKRPVDDKNSHDDDRFELLALILRKVRERITGGKLRNLQKNGSLPEHWWHKLLDSAAESVFCDFPATDSHVHFVCSTRRQGSRSWSAAKQALDVPELDSKQHRSRRRDAALGGSAQDDRICFLSADTVHKMLGSILKCLTSVLIVSTFEWARFAYAVLLPTEREQLEVIGAQSFSPNIEMAHFAFKVLEGSLFALKMIEDDSLFPSILAALFIIEWECSMALTLDEGRDLEGYKEDFDVESSAYGSSADHLDEKMHLKANLAESIHTFCQNLSPSFWSELHPCTLNSLLNILAHSVRCALFQTVQLQTKSTSVLCSEWVVDMLKLIRLNSTKLQSFFDLLLSEGEFWPLWVKPSLQNENAPVKIQFETVITDETGLKHHQFVAFVDKLVLNLGFGEVILGVPGNTSTVPSFSRAWVAAEILCTWKWKGGSVFGTFLPSLIQHLKLESCAEVSILSLLLDTLLEGAFHECSQWVLFNAWHICDNEIEKIEDRFLRALVALLFSINNINDSIWRESDALEFFKKLLSNLFISSTVNRKCVKTLPFVMSTIIKPHSGKLKLNETSCYTDLVGKSILNWLDVAISCLSSNPREVVQQDIVDWMQVVLSCFPLNITGGAQKLEVKIEREISDAERSLLLTLFQKYQTFCVEAPSLSTSGTTQSTMVELLGVKLTAVMVGYCWTRLQENDLHFVFHAVQKWVESAILLVEEMTDAINDAVINHKSNEDTLEKLKLLVSTIDELTLSFGESALVTLCHLKHLVDIQETENFQSLQIIRSGDYAERNNKMMESMLRLFLASGVSEAIARSCCEEASSIIASSRVAYMHFWELVASFVIYASPQTRRCALESMELWGLAKGSVSGLYSILFSSHPISHLQFAAYSLLLSEPLCQFSLVKDCSLGLNRPLTQESNMGQSVELMPDSEKTLDLREELSSLIEMPTSELLQTDLLARDRVDAFIAWSLLLSHLQLLPPASIAREKHIPLRTGAPCGKKKDVELMPEAEVAAIASKNAIITCSLLPCIEFLWPVGTWQMASLAGGLYGMMIRLLPSYVRTWFTSLRDRSLSSSIESFTRAWCSPPLLLDEFSQVKDSLYADDNFSVSVNRSAYEIVATYKKEETGIDLVIRLPNCYPLRHVDVECTRSLGVSEVKCRKWLLSLTAFVRNQNGAIAEAINTWKSNFDKEFEGVEECPICYSILHTSNHSLPRLACKTCRHKFHGACLYKWFSTSNKSTCPLCQTPF
uniref:E3 ubiquitin-protein ligase listerin n=1 Tax=Leersia perrieri TaxID=77586 RepID=A0A0D9VAZ7_9ORYZ